MGVLGPPEPITSTSMTSPRLDRDAGVDAVALECQRATANYEQHRPGRREAHHSLEDLVGPAPFVVLAPQPANLLALLRREQIGESRMNQARTCGSWSSLTGRSCVWTARTPHGSGRVRDSRPGALACADDESMIAGLGRQPVRRLGGQLGRSRGAIPRRDSGLPVSSLTEPVRQSDDE